MRYFLILLLVSAIFGAPPRTINYQGKLTDSAGIALDGTYSITFILHSSDTSTDTLWLENHTSVSVHRGLFDIIIGSSTPFPDSVDFSQQYWLETVVNGEIMNPRVPLNSVPYSIRSCIADSLVGGISIDHLSAGQGLYSTAETLHIGASYGIGISADSIWIDTISLDTRYLSAGGQWVRDDDTGYVHPLENTNVKVFDDTATYGIAIRAVGDTAAVLGKSGPNDAGYLGSYLIYPVDAGYLQTSQKYRFPVYGVSIDSGAAVAGYNSAGYGGLFTYAGTGRADDAIAAVYGLDISGTNCGLVGATDGFDFEAPYDTAVTAGVYGLAGGSPGFYVGAGGTEGDVTVDVTGDGLADASSNYLAVALGASFGIDDKAGVLGKNYYFSGSTGYHGVGVQGWSYQTTPSVKGVGLFGLGGYAGVVGLGYYYGGLFAGEISGGKSLGNEVGSISASLNLGIYAAAFDKDNIGSAYFHGNEYISEGVRVSLVESANKQNRDAIYTIEGIAPQVIVSGRGQLENGIAHIEFDDVFTNATSENVPIIITVTPSEPCGQLYVERDRNLGFTVKENNGGSNARFGWIAIGVRKGYENSTIPEKVADKDFEKNLLNKLKEQSKKAQSPAHQKNKR